jgi:hypothetical protein
MSDTTPQPEAPAQEVTPEEIDWKAKAREWERRAKENKSAADELASLRDSQKTAEQRFEERLAEVEKRAAEAESNALRSNIAAKFGLAPEDRDLFLTGLTRPPSSAQAQRLSRAGVRRQEARKCRPERGRHQEHRRERRTPRLRGGLFNNAD